MIGKLLGASVVLIACFCAILLPTAAVDGAPPCYAPTYYAPTYAPTIIKREVVKEYVPYAVPTAYPILALPVYSYVNAPGYVPGFAPAAGYGSILQPPAQTQAQAIDTDKIAELVFQKLEKRGVVPPAANPMLQNPGTQNPGTQSPGGPPPVAKPGVRVDQQEAATKVAALFQAKCFSCHSGAATAGGGLVLFDADKSLKWLTSDARIAVYDAIYEARMPKDSQALSDQDVELVRLWLKQKPK